MTKTKTFVPAAMLAILWTVASAAQAEDAASASYQMRMAAYENPSAVTAALQPADPDQPRPIRMKLHRHAKKAHASPATHPASIDDDVALADPSKSN